MASIPDSPFHDSDTRIGPSPDSSKVTTRHALARSIDQLTQGLSKLAFWGAIALPVIYLPLLFAGLETTTDLLVFLSLFMAHILALVLDQTYINE